MPNYHYLALHVCICDNGKQIDGDFERNLQGVKYSAEYSMKKKLEKIPPKNILEKKFNRHARMRLPRTVIRFDSTSAKYGFFTVVLYLNGTLVEDKMRTFSGGDVDVLASTSVPFRSTTVQNPNLALI
jgi:hypothetical protein